MGIVLSWHRFNTRSVIFFSFFGLFFYLFKNQSIYYNRNVLSKPLKVIVYICIASKSAFERFAHKDAACKTEAFLHTLFLENKAQTDQKNYGTMLFMSIKSVCQKLARSCKKWKSAQNWYMPFLHEGLQLLNVDFHSWQLIQSLLVYPRGDHSWLISVSTL